ncbi:hypothetical protein CLV94_1823 [Flavobacterium endophyticum]|uniref:DUF748 domain-containing protein n=1 Tax=Flavobacterium endophyticum TaxID=1540163 RepID=A0A495MLC0_9FLAO|nr:hypothetical protein [Flavobacterium endophyticum]RKS26754.1 hypothetical protein CLV94_1823 [Flavobacterium endophyticum]
MVWWKKVVIGIGCLLILTLVLNIGLNYWIRKQLPVIINENNNSPYQITYKTLEVALWDGNAVAKDITVVPKSSLQKKDVKSGIYATIQSIKVEGISAWSIVFSKRIVADKIVINKSEIILFKDNDKALNDPKSIRDKVIAPFKNTISVSDIYLFNSGLQIISTVNNKASLIVHNLSMQLDGITLDDTTLKEKIPFSYKNFEIDCDSIYYRASEFYHLTAKKIHTDKSDLKIADFSMIPEYNRPEFVRKIPKEKDIFTVNAQEISINNMDWGFKDDVFYFNSTNIFLEKVFASIYRPKMPPDDLSKKPLYNKLLREIKFPLHVDTLAIRESTLEYEEEKTFEKGAGLLSFNKFNMFVTDINSGYNQKKLPDVKITINCKFMNVSPMKVNWRFNVLDKSDGFNIKGSIFQFPAHKLRPFTKPYMNVAVEGKLNEVYFNFTGNDVKSKGDFAIKYDDIKVTVYQKKNPQKKNKFLSAVGNLFVKNDSNEKIVETEVEVERIQEKSFYNFFWRNIGEGLKKTLL